MLSRLYLAKGRIDIAKEVLEDYLVKISDNGIIHSRLALIHLIQRDFKKAEEEIQKAYTLSPEINKWYELFLLLFTKRFSAADNLLEVLTVSDRAYDYWGFQSVSYTLQGRLEEAKDSLRDDIERWRANFDADYLAWYRLWEAVLLETKGDFEEALAACDDGLIIGREADLGIHVCQALFRRGVIQLKVEDLVGAERTAEELKLAVESGPAPKRICYHEGLFGLINAYKKDTNLAIQHFEKALNLTPVYHGYNYNPRYEILYYLGESLEQTGQWDRAKKSYEEILSLFDDYNWSVEIPLWVKAHYKLARVFEQMGDKEGAARYYREFLDYWQNADPGLPEVDEAKKRLAALSLK
jgi:tetratricopeptide (TPR) repeat protein